jgi:hypothetical protein
VSTEGQEPKKPTIEEQIEKAWSYHAHADNIQTARVNFFLVAESMLVVSFATVVQADKPLGVFLRFAIVMLGMIYTAGWFVINLSIIQRMHFLRDTYLMKDRLYIEYWNAFKFFNKWSDISGLFIIYVLPLSVLFFWLILLGFSIYVSSLTVPEIYGL